MLVMSLKGFDEMKFFKPKPGSWSGKWDWLEELIEVERWKSFITPEPWIPFRQDKPGHKMCDKHAHQTRAGAELELKIAQHRKPDDAMRVYECHICGYYHIGHYEGK